MENLNERDWALLLGRIQDRECTPFLGAGACAGTLPLGAQIAREWTAKYGFPMKEHAGDLARVAQYLALGDARFPKREIRALLLAAGDPDFDAEDEPHAVLAELELPLYLTTNYDDFMTKALKRLGKSPSREICNWRERISNGQRPALFETAEGFDPIPEAPLVYHLHGHLDELDSLVLTEDDYLDFLVSISRRAEKASDKRSKRFTATSPNTSMK